jgi:hypothetical protein
MGPPSSGPSIEIELQAFASFRCRGRLIYRLGLDLHDEARVGEAGDKQQCRSRRVPGHQGRPGGAVGAE